MEDNKDVKAKVFLSPLTKKILFSVLAVVVAVALFFLGFLTRPFCYDKTSFDILEIIKLTKENYDGEFEITDDEYGKLITKHLLDDYSTYYTEEEYERIKAQGEGRKLGIGLGFLTTQIEAVIYSVEGNSPAYFAGMKKGEKLIRGQKGGVITEFINKESALSFLGAIEENEEISLTTRLADGVTEKTYTIIKKKYSTNYVTYFDSEYKYDFRKEYEEETWKAIGMANNGEDGIVGLPADVAYISFSLFEGDVDKQLNLAFSVMKNRGRTKLILDLRSNGGGYMDTLCAVAPYFIDTNGGKTPIAVAKYKNGSEETFYSRSNKFNKDITSISVIADANTASAAECLLGAMLHYKTAFDLSNLIIDASNGKKASTYGKGIMQSSFYLTTGSVLKLTVAHVYQPDRETCIHGVGIVPYSENVAVSATSALEMAIDRLN